MELIEININTDIISEMVLIFLKICEWVAAVDCSWLKTFTTDWVTSLELIIILHTAPLYTPTMFVSCKVCCFVYLLSESVRTLAL